MYIDVAMAALSGHEGVQLFSAVARRPREPQQRKQLIHGIRRVAPQKQGRHCLPDLPAPALSCPCARSRAMSWSPALLDQGSIALATKMRLAVAVSLGPTCVMVATTAARNKHSPRQPGVAPSELDGTAQDHLLDHGPGDAKCGCLVPYKVPVQIYPLIANHTTAQT